MKGCRVIYSLCFNANNNVSFGTLEYCKFLLKAVEFHICNDSVINELSKTISRLTDLNNDNQQLYINNGARDIFLRAAEISLRLSKCQNVKNNLLFLLTRPFVSAGRNLEAENVSLSFYLLSYFVCICGKYQMLIAY